MPSVWDAAQTAISTTSLLSSSHIHISKCLLNISTWIFIGNSNIQSFPKNIFPTTLSGVILESSFDSTLIPHPICQQYLQSIPRIRLFTTTTHTDTYPTFFSYLDNSTSSHLCPIPVLTFALFQSSPHTPYFPDRAQI